MSDREAFFLLVVFDALAMRWRPLLRTEKREGAEGMFATLRCCAGGFFDLFRVEGFSIDDVEAVEAFCASVRPVGLAQVFSAYADVAEHAYVLGGGRFVRVLPDNAVLH